MVLNRVDHDVLGCLGRWVGGHRSPGAARTAGRRATAATAAAAAAAQVRASQGQPVCTAQESTWWYPLPAEERTQCRWLGILDTAVAAGGVQDVINCHYFNQVL